MDVLIRAYAAWKGRRRAAQIIVFDGAAEVETSRAYLRGALVGAGITLLLVMLIAPGTVSPDVLHEFERREALVQEARERSDQAASLVHACLRTAEGMEETLLAYRQALGRPGPARPK
jgi:hypothetical protein